MPILSKLTALAVARAMLAGGRRPSLSRSEFDRLKAILHRCVTDGPAAQNHDCQPHRREHLRGRVEWAAELNPNKALRLQRLFNRIDWPR
jgi:hypothetical protein